MVIDSFNLFFSGYKEEGGYSLVIKYSLEFSLRCSVLSPALKK